MGTKKKEMGDNPNLLQLKQVRTSVGRGEGVYCISRDGVSKSDEPWVQGPKDQTVDSLSRCVVDPSADECVRSVAYVNIFISNVISIISFHFLTVTSNRSFPRSSRQQQTYLQTPKDPSSGSNEIKCVSTQQIAFCRSSSPTVLKDEWRERRTLSFTLYQTRYQQSWGMVMVCETVLYLVRLVFILHVQTISWHPTAFLYALQHFHLSGFIYNI